MSLLGYLLVSYVLSYMVHVPVHGGRHAFIPASVPWGISAAVAIWCTATRRSLRIAWITLATACVFFILPHTVMRHR